MARLVMRCLIALSFLAACDADPVRPEPSDVGGQVRDCWHVEVPTCHAAIEAVIDRVPETATSAIAVLTTLDPNLGPQPGRDTRLIVAFQRSSGMDPWMDPPTWIVTRTFGTGDWWIAPWRNRDLPAHFLRRLIADGVIR